MIAAHTDHVRSLRLPVVIIVTAVTELDVDIGSVFHASDPVYRTVPWVGYAHEERAIHPSFVKSNLRTGIASIIKREWALGCHLSPGAGETR